MCKFGNPKHPALSITNKIKNMKKAVVLLSGGLDSSTTLFFALDKGYKCECLSFDYGQRHKKELAQARAMARSARCSFTVVKISLPWKGSSLLDRSLRVPQEGLKNDSIPSTYVPGRNIIFLSFAASFAETAGAAKIFIGANAIDYSGYPDCRPSFLKAYEKALGQGLKTSVEGKPLRIEAPLVNLSKAQIVRLALKLDVPLHLTWSCYQGGKRPCGVCDSCRLRAKGFQEAGREDPAS
jgi:7-cyano-7-deazaguanine synthase